MKVTTAQAGTRGRGARTRSATAAAVCLGLTFTVVACDGSAPGPASVGSSGSTRTQAPPVEFTTSVRPGAKDVRPDAQLTVAATNGQLRAVRLVGGGHEFAGVTENGRWRLADVLTTGTKFTLTMTAADAEGQSTEKSMTFSTLTPQVEATYRVSPDKQTVGVGMPVMVTFDSSVKTPAMRAAVEKRLSVKTVPAQSGSWGWLSDNQIAWRPATYWKPNTKVTVNAPLKGVQTGEGKWVTADSTASFTVSSRARISTVDIAGHTMTVRENGKTVATYAVSSGRPERNYATRTGTKVITEKLPFMVMDAASLGVPKDDPNYYRTEVNWAMRITDTGEFLHSAPWSTWAQGRQNVSHGCVNMGPRDAKEMFQSSMVGDVVDFVDGNREMQPGDGLSVWLYSYPQWKAKSALHAEPKKKGKPAAGHTTPGGSPTGGPSASSTARS